MKREEYRLSGLWGAVLGFCAAFGGIACLVTAFDFREISLGTIALWLAVAAVLVGTGFALKAGWAPLPVLLFVLLYTWYNGSLIPSVEALVHEISFFYDKGYGWGTVQWSGEAVYRKDMLLALCVIGTAILYLLCLTVTRRRGGWLAVPLSMLPLASCLVVTDTVPDAWCLGLYFGTLGLLLLTAAVRRQSERRANRLTAVLLLPVALVVAVLFLASPRDAYDGQTRAELWSGYFVNRFNTLLSGTPLFQGNVPGPYAGEAGATVDLQAVGPKIDRYTPVMDVVAARDGFLYLRGRSYDTYDGKGWSASDHIGMDSQSNWYRNKKEVGEVTVTTRDIHSVLYLPYNIKQSQSYNRMVRGMLRNNEDLLEYSFTQIEAPTLDTEGDYRESMMLALPEYVALPEQTLERARQYLIENIPLVEEYFAFEEYYYYLAWSHLDTELSSSSSLTVIFGDTGEYAWNVTGDLWLYPVVGFGLLEYDEAGVPIKPENFDRFAGMSDVMRRQLVVKAIAEHVQNSARYSLNTPRMPAGEEDFALWFLEDSDTGYCVHYATAATVLLRAAGIPARYVTGYMVDGREGRSVTVREKDAHAWVEVYQPGGIGWTMVEVTGGYGEEPPAPTEPTEAPNETTAPPTVPPETTQPPETTGPAATRPTEPKPTEPSAGEEEPPLDLTWLREALKWLTALTLAVTLILGQRYLRLQLRLRRFTQGTPNARALARWRELERLCRMLKQEPDGSLVSLARKAKFSQHTLTEEELSAFDAALETAQAQLRAKPWPQRLWYSLARAAC